MDPDYQNALTQGLLGTANGSASISPQALVQGLLGSLNGGGNYRDPQSWTPEMIKSQQAYGDEMMKPTTVRRPWQGADEMVRALLGGNAVYQANQAQQGAISNAAQQYATAQQQASASDAAGSPAGASSADTSAGFDSAYNRLLGFEGGYNAHDTNGTPSNFGVNQAANPDIDVSKLTPQTAKAVYKQRYWDAIGADNMPPALARVAFDTAAVAGPTKANELIAQAGGDPNKLLSLRANFQNGLVQSDPAKYGKYAGAWADRNQALSSDVSAMTSGTGSAGNGAPPGGFTHPLAQALAGYKSGIDPKLAAAIVTNPWQTPEAKAFVQGRVNPLIVRDGFGSQYYSPTGGAPQSPVPGAGPGALPTSFGAGSAHSSGYAVRDPQTGAITYVGGAGDGGDNYSSLRKLGQTGGEIEAANRNTVGDAEGDVRVVNNAKASSFAAQQSLAGLQEADRAAQKAGYGLVPNIQAIAGNYGLDTSGLSDIQAFQKIAGAVAASDPVMGSHLAAALPTMSDTVKSRQMIMDNLIKIAQRQSNMGKLAFDQSVPLHERASKLIDFPLPQDEAAKPTEAPASASGTTPPAAGAPSPAQGDIVSITTPAQARALQPGTKFRTPDGRVMVR